jgi:hypothetical protein
MADKVDRGAVVGVFREFLGQFLDPVFSAAVHSSGNSFADGIGVVHLGGGAEQDVFGVSAGSNGGFVHPAADLSNIICDRHMATLLS